VCAKGIEVNRIDLEGNRAVITGGAQGVGLSIGKRLLDCGAVVTFWDINQPVLDEAVKELRQGVVGYEVAYRLW